MFLRKFAKDRRIPADKESSQRLARHMTINDRNLTGTTPAEAGRSQETQKPNRNQGVRTGTAASDKTGDRVELSSTLATLPAPSPRLDQSAPIECKP